ncbi:hypothetical protein FOA52_002895 [Chlamydomonas sp. UWO 241]|nr:hypothetical protein FOA52_002895 [Chlamydomonas sp. UWO 241]
MANHGPSVDVEVQAACTAIWVAASEGDVAALERLLCVGKRRTRSTSAEADLESMQHRAMLVAADGRGKTALLHAAESGHAEAMRLLLEHPSADPAVMLIVASKRGRSALGWAALGGHVDAMHVLLNHSCADPAAMMMLISKYGSTALTYASQEGRVDVMRVLLDHSSADAAAMMGHGDSHGNTAFMPAAFGGHVDAMRLLLGHPSTGTAAMMMRTSCRGSTAFMLSAQNGHVDAMRVLLDHPSADAAAMMMHARPDDWNALLWAARNGHAEAMGLLLDHPSADPTDPARVVTRSCAPLLLLLCRVAVASQPSHAHKAHMRQVVEALRQGPRFHEIFFIDQPDDARDECVRLLLAGGVTDLRGRVVVRIVHEMAQMARVPQIVNKAIVGRSVARQVEFVADAATMMIARIEAAQTGNVVAMRLLLEHPSAVPATMMMHARSDISSGSTALVGAAQNGHVDAMRLLLDHPSAVPATMMMRERSYGSTALSLAVGFAAGQRTDSSRAPPRSCAPLLLLLHRVAVASQPSYLQQQHLNRALQALCQGPRSDEMFGSGQPNDAHECVRLLLASGATDLYSPVVQHIICEMAQQAHVPQLLNEAIVGLAVARHEDH